MLRTSRVVTYSLLLILILLTLYVADRDWLQLQQDKVLSAVQPTTMQAESPDAYLQDITIKTYSDSGNLVTSTKAESSQHYPRQAVTIIAQPVIFYRTKDNTEWQVFADRGLREDKSEDLSLIGGVKAERQHDKLRLLTEELHWHSDTRVASSRSKINIYQEHNVLHSQGFKANLEQQIYELPNNVKATYTP